MKNTFILVFLLSVASNSVFGMDFLKKYSKSSPVRYLVGTVTGYSVPTFLGGTLLLLFTNGKIGLKPFLIGGSSFLLGTIPHAFLNEKQDEAFALGCLTGGLAGVCLFLPCIDMLYRKH